MRRTIHSSIPFGIKGVRGVYQAKAPNCAPHLFTQHLLGALVLHRLTCNEQNHVPSLAIRAGVLLAERLRSPELAKGHGGQFATPPRHIQWLPSPKQTLAQAGEGLRSSHSRASVPASPLPHLFSMPSACFLHPQPAEDSSLPPSLPVGRENGGPRLGHFGEFGPYCSSEIKTGLVPADIKATGEEQKGQLP